MQRDFKLRNYRLTKSQNPQRGYMMITLMLAVALITIGLLAVLPEFKQQAQRDREEELRHRGTAYMRAIQHFYKKFGRYPTSIAELENTNNIRFLRKHYTDPMSRDPKTGKEKDFKILHQQDITLNNGPVLPGQTGQSGPGGQTGLQGQSGLSGSASGGFGGLGAQTGGFQQTGTGGQTSASGDSGSSSSGSSGASGNSNSSGSSSSNSTNSNASGSGSGLSGQTFGGGPFVGVASTNNKTKAIRVFFDKTHYSDWLFIYVTQLDRGGLLVGPVNPNMPPTANLNGLTPGIQTGAGMPGQGLGGQGLGGQGLGGQGLSGQGGLGPGQSPAPPQNPAPPPQQ
jgi:type II secretory pathway pseudopilin PulG